MKNAVYYLLAVFTLLCILSLPGCTTVTRTPEPTPTLASTPTMPPTTIPGSSADENEVTDIVRQFGLAVAREDEIVALLMLTPSAQRVVASSNLHAFLGKAEKPRWLSVRQVQLDKDVAVADCMIGYPSEEHPLKLRLVRLDGEWKIDTRIADQ